MERYREKPSQVKKQIYHTKVSYNYRQLHNAIKITVRYIAPLTSHQLHSEINVSVLEPFLYNTSCPATDNDPKFLISFNNQKLAEMISFAVEMASVSLFICAVMGRITVVIIQTSKVVNSFVPISADQITNSPQNANKFRS